MRAALKKMKEGPGRWLESHLPGRLDGLRRLDQDPPGFGQQVASFVSHSIGYSQGRRRER